MKLILVHGEHLLDSAKRMQVFIDTAKKRGWEIERIEKGRGLREVLTSQSLFGIERLFIVKDATKLSKKELSWFTKNNEKLEGTLIIYAEGVISKGLLSQIPKINKVEEFKLPKLIFKFMESFSPGNSQLALGLLHKVTENDPPEFVLALLSRHLRDLYLTLVKAKLPYPPWRISKLKSQADKFPKDLLEEVVNELARADVEGKTSKKDLVSSIDLIIATKLK